MAFGMPLSATLTLSAVQAAVLILLNPPFLRSLSPYVILLLMTVVHLFAWIIYRILYPYFFSPLRGLPCPPGANFFMGHSISQVNYPRGQDYLKFIKEIPNDGLIRLRGMFNIDGLLLTSPKALTEVLVTRPYEFPKPERTREILRGSIGDGLIVAEGNIHKRQRKHSLPSFNFRQVKDLYPLFWEKSVKMVKCIDARVFAGQDGALVGTTDIEYWIPKATLDIIGIAGIGRDFNSLENSEDEIARLYEELTSPSDAMKLHVVVHLVLGQTLADILCFSTARTVRRTTTSLRAHCETFVKEKRARLGDPDDKSIDILTALMKLNAFSDEELVDQLLNIMAAGHETTSSTFTWLIYLLSLNPDIQDRLRDEVRAALPAGLSWNDSNTSNNDLGALLESLPLLNGVCNETLRVFPTVPLTVRTNKQDTTILGHFIRADTEIFVVPWATNKDPAIWGPDAHEFKPERWIDPVTGKPNQTGGVSNNYAFLTFIHGPRSCIGQNFARSELRALVAAFIGTYKWSLEDPNAEVVPAGMVTTKPRDGMRIKITKPGDW